MALEEQFSSSRRRSSSKYRCAIINKQLLPDSYNGVIVAELLSMSTCCRAVMKEQLLPSGYKRTICCRAVTKEKLLPGSYKGAIVAGQL